MLKQEMENKYAPEVEKSVYPPGPAILHLVFLTSVALRNSKVISRDDKVIESFNFKLIL